MWPWRGDGDRPGGGGGRRWRRRAPAAKPGAAARVTGIRTYFGSTYGAGPVILTAGTFLGSQIWVDNQSMSAGEQAVVGLTEALQALGFRMDRLKTGTPPRVAAGWILNSS
ncbi:MAG: FAD-dependent oxidoreductase, partial [Anderseniella sp.]|nr:FAD-dependent oxidoreductase [Anderseniella sp.]